MKTIETNKAEAIGFVTEPFGLDHKVHGEGFYRTTVRVARDSGAHDDVPIIVSERLTDVTKSQVGNMVAVIGQFRSYNKPDESGKRKLILFLFAQAFQPLSGGENSYWNRLSLIGTICKPVIYRVTPLGREVADVMLAVNRAYGKSDYIPCLCWGRDANWVRFLETGQLLRIKGRIQSREYQKKLGEDEIQTRTAYEVSVQEVEVYDEEDNIEEDEA